MTGLRSLWGVEVSFGKQDPGVRAQVLRIWKYPRIICA
jgi:hypothetical protein